MTTLEQMNLLADGLVRHVYGRTRSSLRPDLAARWFSAAAELLHAHVEMEEAGIEPLAATTPDPLGAMGAPF